MTNLEIFAEIMRSNFYFSESVEKRNHLEWDDERTAITIYNDDDFRVSGVGSIGQAAEALGLCCTAYFSIYDRRLTIRVH